MKGVSLDKNKRIASLCSALEREFVKKIGKKPLPSLRKQLAREANLPAFRVMKTKDNAHFHIVLVKGWVHKKGKFLLAKRAATELHMPGVWSLPGGKIDKGDGNVRPYIVEETLKREAKEEVGVDIEDEMRLVYTSSFTRIDGAHVVNLTFVCKYKAGKARPLDQTAEVRWVSLDELQDFIEAPDFLKREIKALMRFLENYEKQK